MNKKIIIGIIAIVIAIGAIAISYTSLTPTNTVLVNQTSNTVTTTGKHFAIQLNESMSIKGNP